jgi:hypothetical protein
MIYKLIKPLHDTILQSVFYLETDTYIPFDEANADYQTYLAWLEAGNTPEPWEDPDAAE